MASFATTQPVSPRRSLVQPHLLKQRLEARVGAQRVEIGVDFPPSHPVPPLYLRLCQRGERLIELAKPYEYGRDGTRGYELIAHALAQMVQRLSRFHAVARIGVDAPE